jgi:hypothetical protein
MQISEEFPFHTEITSVYADSETIVDSPKRSVSAKFANVHTNLELLILRWNSEKRDIVLSHFHFEKDVFLPFIHFNALYLSILSALKLFKGVFACLWNFCGNLISVRNTFRTESRYEFLSVRTFAFVLILL